MAARSEGLTPARSEAPGLRLAVESWDRRVLGKVAAHPAPVLDVVLPRLSRAANHSALWMVVATVLALTGNAAARRAAWRGAAGVAASSLVVNGLVKQTWSRPRPELSDTPVGRRLTRPPTSSSFPSGHAASAVAFTAGVAQEAPTVAAVLAPVAAGVAWSRVHVGVHHPSDVLVGATLGLAVGASSRWWWRPR